MENFLGRNLNRALTNDGNFLILDGREMGNPSAERRTAPGLYRVTDSCGTPPGDVSYFGEPVEGPGFAAAEELFYLRCKSYLYIGDLVRIQDLDDVISKSLLEV